MSQMSRRSGGRGGVALVFGVLLTLLAVWWLWPSGAPAPAERSPSTASPRALDPRLPAPLPEPPAPEASATRDGGTLWLQAQLEPSSSGRAFAGQAWVGPAYISEADRLEWEEARREERGGAGPERLEELANVETWLPAPVTPEAAGGGRLGLAVPPAPRYRLLAWEPEGTLYQGDFVPAGTPREGVLDAGRLQARPATGLRVRLTRAPPGRTRYLARLERVVDEASAERATGVLPVMRLVAPVLLGALREEGAVPLSVEGDNLLVPLPPDKAVRLRLRTEAGLEGEPLEVPLREGRVETVEVDLGRVFPGGGESFVDLRGRLLLGASARPVARARVERLEAPGPVARPGADGTFTFEKLPAWKPSRFAVLVERPASGRPVSPERTEVELTPGPGPHERPVEVTWRVPAYRWLVLKLDAFARSQLEGRSRRPYPVYALQRRDEAGSWRTQGADEFLPEEGGVAVSVLGVGTYRVLAAASPYEVYESPAVVVGEGDLERAVSLSVPEDAVPCEVRVTDARGVPVYGALVTAAGAQGSLPPIRGRTDAEGRWRLGRVRAQVLHLEVEHGNRSPWTGEVSAECQRTGRVDVRP